MHPGVMKSTDADFSSQSLLQQIALGLLALVALACVHALLYHLHYILAPFILSGLLVFAVEPSVTLLYNILSGRSPPYRWCCCCMRRRWSRQDRQLEENAPSSAESGESDTEERLEMEMLLGDRGTSWHGFFRRIADGVCRLVAVAAIISCLMFIAFLLISMLAHGAAQVKDHFKDYQKGIGRLLEELKRSQDWFVKRFKLSGMASQRVQAVYANVLSNVQVLLMALVDAIAAFVTGGVSFGGMVLLYMLFWLFQPLPISGSAAGLVRSYIWKKTLVSVLYGCSVAMWLHFLEIDLATFFGIVSFVLNYVPEVGACISMLSPMPVILLDGKLDNPIAMLILATSGQICLKFAISNVLEMTLIQNDTEMSMHPVWVLLGLNYFGLIWGLPGMLMSVPVLATLKSLAISAEVDLRATHPLFAVRLRHFLACVEGRRKHVDHRQSGWLLPLPLHFSVGKHADGSTLSGDDKDGQQLQTSAESPTDVAGETRAPVPSEAGDAPTPFAPKKARQPTGAAPFTAAPVEQTSLPP